MVEPVPRTVLPATPLSVSEAELNRNLAEWTADKDPLELFHVLQDLGVPAGPVQNEAQACACVQLNQRSFFEEQTHPEAGTHKYPGLIFKMDRTHNHLRGHAPMLGEHNERIYRELLGVDEAEYGRLEALGHIGMDYPPGAS